MRILKYSLPLFLTFSFTYALTFANSQNKKQSGYVIGKDLPYSDLPVPDFIKRVRFELNSDSLEEFYDLIRNKIQKRQKILKNTWSVSVLMKPDKRYFKNVDHLYLTTAYITQIIFPQNMKITNAVASFATTFFDFSSNELRIRPSKDFVDGNIVVHLSDGNKNYTINILTDNYIQKNCKIENSRLSCKKKYSGAYENVAVIYSYSLKQPISDLEIIKLYEKLYKTRLNIKKDGDFVSFVYKDVTYYIYRDDTFGNVFYNGKKYRIKK